MKPQHELGGASGQGGGDPVLTATLRQYEQAGEPIAQFFAFSHLPPVLADVSREFARLAVLVLDVLPRNPERTVALRKLLEAKDAAVRAKLYRSAGGSL